MGRLDEFFEDERRRNSPERLFGMEWRSEHDPDSVYTIFWLADTRELCALQAPRRDVKVGGGTTNIFAGGEIWTNIQRPRNDELTVSVLGLIDDVERLDEVLQGWDDHLLDPDGLEWVKRAVGSSER
jgi:hypothetical protein